MFILIKDDFFFQDIMIESEIIASGSAKGVLLGKHYNRAIQIHKLLYEAMQTLRLEAFDKSLTTEEKMKA